MATPIAPSLPKNDPIWVINQPDGFYWRDQLTNKLHGPFPTQLEAAQHMEEQNDSYEEGESLEDAEVEIGITNWIDPETGEPSEGLSLHLSED
ncbi:MAG: hypothetical protein ABI536_09230 [Gallionella sp.]